MEGRVEFLNSVEHNKDILYLMNRDQRIYDNYSVELGFDLSYQSRSKFFIGIDIKNIKMNQRQKSFILQELEEMKEVSDHLNIPLLAINNLESFLNNFSIDCIILDFCPLKESQERMERIKHICDIKQISLLICDSHNLVPCKLLKQYKRTPKAVRTDLYKLYNKYLKEFKVLTKHLYNLKTDLKPNENSIFNVEFEEIKNLNLFLDAESEKRKFDWSCNFIGGYKNGIKTMEEFYKNRLNKYNKERNDPESFACSNLSPWLHTGQISSQRVILEGYKTNGSKSNENLDSFINEIFIWRETAEHFVFHEVNYDNIQGGLPWARETLIKHSSDKRPIIYTKIQFEEARTYDELWNAAQHQLLKTGKIHGYVRMYWAKRILEWSESPEEAIQIAIYLNDKYSIDGNDCSGYLGVMWCICGSLDRAFKEREIFGKIRFMSKIKCPRYIKKWN